MADKWRMSKDRIGNYHLIDEISQGAFGHVYRARHIVFHDEDRVAIKVYHLGPTTQEEQTQFVQEAQFLKRLRHPHIIHVIDAGFQDDVPYIVMDYAAYGSLRDQLKHYKGSPLPLHEALNILAQIGDALQYAHHQKIVHRDLKPENILFREEGKALLADFGIATVLPSNHTIQKDGAGTPAYMAPEQFAGTISPKSDQYALGCIAYELVTGLKPFARGPTPLEVLWYRHQHMDPVPPGQYNPHLPSYVEAAILKAMVKDRMERHKDVAAFIAALQGLAEQRSEEDEVTLRAERQPYDVALSVPEQKIHQGIADADVYTEKGYALNNLQRFEEAIGILDLAIRQDPTNAYAYTEKGYALNNLQRFEEAIEVFEQAIRLNHAEPIAYRRLGYALNNLHRYEEAIATLTQAIRLDATDPYAYIQKGYALNSLHHYEDALDVLEHALRLAPTNIDAGEQKQYALSRLYT